MFSLIVKLLSHLVITSLTHLIKHICPTTILIDHPKTSTCSTNFSHRAKNMLANDQHICPTTTSLEIYIKTSLLTRIYSPNNKNSLKFSINWFFLARLGSLMN